MDIVDSSSFEQKSGDDLERRRISVLFADLVGSTDLMETLGSDEYAVSLRSFHSLCTDAVRSRGGTLAQYQGDGVMCFFGYPTVAEDDASHAVSAALDILGALQSLGDRLGHRLQTRIGIASGNAIISRGSDQFGGETVGACVNLASRLQDLAETGTILICDDTLELVGGAFKARSQGMKKVKGFADLKLVHEVIDVATGAITRFDARRNRFDGPLVGRQGPLDSLLSGLAEARTGKGYSIGLCGPAGIGKSRIFRALEEHEDAANIPSFVLQCASEYDTVSLHPVSTYLDWITGVRRVDTSAVRRQKLTRLFQTVWNADDQETDLLLDLIAPETVEGPPDGDDTATLKRGRAFDVLIARMFGAVGRHKAFKLIFEDIHWSDPTTLEFLARVAKRIDEFPVLLIATTRPEGEELLGQCGLKEQIVLEPLSQEHAETLARTVSQMRGLDSATIKEIVRMAEGVPLFLEEYAKVAGRDYKGKQASVPLSLSGIVLAKLDQLKDFQLDFAKAGAVLGRNFATATVALMCNLSPAQATHIQESLFSQQILFPDADGQCMFGHALIRQGVYETLDFERKKALHLKAARLYCEGEIEEREAPASLVASHFAHGGDARAAAEWYLKAARTNTGNGAVPEAAADLANAIRQIETLPATEERDQLELLVRAVQGPVLMVMRGPGNPEFGSTQERALGLLEKLNIEDARAPVIFHTALHNWARGDFDEALERVDLLDELAERGGGDEALDLARMTMRGLIAWHAGHNLDAERILGDTARLYDPHKHKRIYAEYLFEFGIFGRFYLSLTKTVMGKQDEAIVLANDAADFANIVRFPHATGFSQLALFVNSMLREDVDACSEQAKKALDYSAAQGFPEFVAMATFALGWVESQRGMYSSGIEKMQGGLAGWDHTGFATWQPIFSAILARSFVEAGRLNDAEAMIANADNAVVLSGEEQARAPNLLARALLERARGDDKLASNIARRAMSVSRHDNAVLWSDQVKRYFPELGQGTR